MDPERFDSFIRSLTTVRTRRSLTRLVGGLTLSTLIAAFGSEQVAAARARVGHDARRSLSANHTSASTLISVIALRRVAHARVPAPRPNRESAA